MQHQAHLVVHRGKSMIFLSTFFVILCFHYSLFILFALLLFFFSTSRNTIVHWILSSVLKDSCLVTKCFYFKYQQESPPAWTQEAYHPPCSKYSLCCPILADPPPPLADWPPPRQDWPHPSWTDPPPPAGLTPPSWTDPPPPRLDWPTPTPGWVGWLIPPLWTDRQTRVKTLPSRRTTYAGGNIKLCMWRNFDAFMLKYIVLLFWLMTDL